MLFYANDLILVEVFEGTSKTGRPFAITNLVDPETYASEKFFLKNPSDATGLVTKRKYDVAVEIREGRASNAVLTPVEKAK